MTINFLNTKNWFIFIKKHPSHPTLSRNITNLAKTLLYTSWWLGLVCLIASISGLYTQYRMIRWFLSLFSTCCVTNALRSFDHVYALCDTGQKIGKNITCPPYARCSYWSWVRFHE
jgi:hypothetical protein